jgi:prepilin-type N-terminal cleavage/methylation domain-containing protein
MNTRRGLTLMELVVALAITGLIMVAGFGGFSTMVDRRATATAAVDRVTGAAAVRRTLTEWLSGAELAINDEGVRFQGVHGTSDGLPDDELTFRTSARTPLADAETMVRLFVDRNDSTPERGLVAQLSLRNGKERRTIELAPTATTLEIRYLTAFDSARVWMGSWISSTVLPLGVRLQLSNVRGDTLPALLVVPLTVPLRTTQ